MNMIYLQFKWIIYSKWQCCHLLYSPSGCFNSALFSLLIKLIMSVWENVCVALFQPKEHNKSDLYKSSEAI